MKRGEAGDVCTLHLRKNSEEDPWNTHVYNVANVRGRT